MSQVITNAFEQYWQSSLAAEQPVVLDEFVLADIPNLDITAPIDPDTGLPPAEQIVHRQAVDQRGRVNNNAVAYSIVMDTTVGDFSFNAMFLRNKANGVIGMIVYKGRETKLKTDQTTGQTGNSLVKSMLMGYDQAAEATLTHVDAGTWQIDYAARLRGMDEDIRQLQADLYGHHTFVGDGFKVVEKDGAYLVSQGVAIIGGLRVELKAPEVIHPGTKPIGVWVDVHRAGSLLSEHQNHFTIITSVADLTDHVDGSGYQHFVAKLATVQANNTIVDGRGNTSSGETSIPDALARLEQADDMLGITSWEALRRSYAKLGFNLRRRPESFRNSGKLTGESDVLLDELTGKAYSWGGPYPHTVVANTDPASPGFTDRSSAFEDAVYATVADVAAGKFPVGKRIALIDRALAVFTVVNGGTANGYNIIGAGAGKTAVLAPFTELNGAAIGATLVQRTLCSAYTGSMLPFLPAIKRAGIKITKRLDEFRFDLDIGRFIGSGSVKLFVSNAGGGSGASPSSPISFDTLQAKITAGDFNAIGSLHIFLTDRIYTRHTTFSDFGQIPCRLYVKSICGGSWLTCKENTTWTTSSPDDLVLSGTYPNVNHLITNLFNLEDCDADGVPVPYKFVATLADFNAAPVRTWYQSGMDIKVKVPVQTRNTMASLVPIREIEKYNPSAANYAVFEDIKFAVNSGCYQNKVTSAWAVYDHCLFYGGKKDGFGILSDRAKTILHNCVSAYAGKDGFNYHAYNATGLDETVGVEINCRSFGAGKLKYIGGNTTTQSNNASTAHDGITIMRLGGEYYDAEGPVLADIQGCKSTNIGCNVGSDTTTNTGQSSGFYAYPSANKPWAADETTLIDVAFKGAYRSKPIAISGTGTLYVQNVVATGLDVPSTLQVKEIKNGY